MKAVNLENKNTNIIFSSIILALVFLVGVIASVTFIHDYNESGKFDTSKCDEIEYISKYSPYLEGTIGDTEIYKFYGTQNTVAVSKNNRSDLSELQSSQIIVSSIQKGLWDTKAMNYTFTGSDEATSDAEAIDAVINGSKSVAIVSYANAKAAVAANSELVICDALVERVPSILIMGGTHPNEPSGQLAATIFLENLSVQRGIFYVITELNKSAFSYSNPQEGQVTHYSIELSDGTYRTFKYGSRLTNVVNQWPVPDVYTHSSGQQLSANEVRNLNRAYPGSVDGSYTEKIAYGITNCINVNDITIVIDLHEASPEYMTNNACVAHDDTSKAFYSGASDKNIQKLIVAELEKIGYGSGLYDMAFDVSPQYLHGLTHRELGDYTNAYVFLFETSCAAIGRIHGAVTEELVTLYDGDKFYDYLAEMEETTGTDYLRAAAVSIDGRVSRHVASIYSVLTSFNNKGGKARTSYTQSYLPESTQRKANGNEYVGSFAYSGIPSIEMVYNNGVGAYLSNLNN